MKTCKEMMNLQGRQVLITGGFGHIGRAIAEALAEFGAELILVDKKVDQDCTEQMGKRFNIAVKAIEMDIADFATYETEFKGLKPIDVLINCAAFVGSSDLDGWTSPVEAQDLDTFLDATKVNSVAPFALTNTFWLI